MGDEHLDAVELERFVTGLADAEASARLEHHVRTCARCAEALRRAAWLELATDEAQAHVVRHVPAAPPRLRHVRGGERVFAALAAAAVVVVTWRVVALREPRSMPGSGTVATTPVVSPRTADGGALRIFDASAIDPTVAAD